MFLYQSSDILFKKNAIHKEMLSRVPANTNQVGGYFHQQPATFDNPNERHVRGDAKAGSRGEKGELATITYNSHFHQETPQHCKTWKLSPQTCCRLEKWQLPVKFRQVRTWRIYLFIKLLLQQLSATSKPNVFDYWDVFFSYPLDMEHQRVHSDKSLILWFSFCLHLKSRPHSED